MTAITHGSGVVHPGWRDPETCRSSNSHTLMPLEPVIVWHVPPRTPHSHVHAMKTWRQAVCLCTWRRPQPVHGTPLAYLHAPSVPRDPPCRKPIIHAATAYWCKAVLGQPNTCQMYRGCTSCSPCQPLAGRTHGEMCQMTERMDAKAENGPSHRLGGFAGSLGLQACISLDAAGAGEQNWDPDRRVCGSGPRYVQQDTKSVWVLVLDLAPRPPYCFTVVVPILQTIAAVSGPNRHPLLACLKEPPSLR